MGNGRQLSGMIKKPFQDPLLYTWILTQAYPVTHFLYYSLSLKWTVTECRRRDSWLPPSGCRLHFLDCWSLINIMSDCKTRHCTTCQAPVAETYLLQKSLQMKTCDLKTARYGHQILWPSDVFCRHTTGLHLSTAAGPPVVRLYRSLMRRNTIGQWTDRLSRGFVKSVLCLFCQSA